MKPSTKFTVFADQKKSLKHDETTPVVFDVSDTGTGKTLVRLLAFERRRKRNGGALLVVATRSLLYSAWGSDIKKFCPSLTFSIANAANRESAFAQDVDVYITNHDAVNWLAKQPKTFWSRFDKGMIVMDESTAFKHHTSMRSKSIAKIVKHFKHRAALTATPNGNSITDVWHQVFLLDDGKRLGSSFYRFRDIVSVPTQVGASANALRWDDRPGAEELVFGLISEITVRNLRKGVPELQTYTRPYILSKKQRDIYDELEASSLLLLQDQKKISAISATAVATKLLQVASGAVYTGLLTDDPDEARYSVVDTGRYELILDLVEERRARHPLVFFFWEHQKNELIKEATARKLNFKVFDGSTNDRDRQEIMESYQAGVLDCVFAHPKSAGHGLTFTKGSVTIWSGPTYDAEIFKQGSGRQNRIGQTEVVENIVIVAEDTIDEKVWTTFGAKDGRMTNLLDLLRS